MTHRKSGPIHFLEGAGVGYWCYVVNNRRPRSQRCGTTRLIGVPGKYLLSILLFIVCLLCEILSSSGRHQWYQNNPQDDNLIKGDDLSFQKLLTSLKVEIILELYDQLQQACHLSLLAVQYKLSVFICALIQTFPKTYCFHQVIKSKCFSVHSFWNEWQYGERAMIGV